MVMTMKRIGLLTSGGDCQGLNAALHGVAKALYEYYDKDVELYGLRDGYRGLIEGDYRLMNREDFSGILCLGGTILGTSRQPFKLMRVVDENSVDKVKAMKATYKKLKLDCYVDKQTISQLCSLCMEIIVLTVVTMPKTIDNDLWGTDKTFGFQSAVNIATNVLDCIHTTATSHGRVFIVELMGHKAGWLTLEAGIAGGADIILIPEIPYENKYIIRAIEKRNAAGKRFSILAVAEGAISKEDSLLTKKELKAKLANRKYPSISYQLAEELQTALGQEVRVTVPGHFQRGGSPCPFDRTLATRLGAAAAQLVINKNYGNMVALRGTDIVPVPLGEVAGKLKVVPKDSDIVQAARQIGVSFGDC